MVKPRKKLILNICNGKDLNISNLKSVTSGAKKILDTKLLFPIFLASTTCMMYSFFSFPMVLQKTRFNLIERLC